MDFYLEAKMTLLDLARRLLALDIQKTIDPDRKKRIEGALEVLETVQPERTFYRVISRSQSTKTHQVTQWWCTCADNNYRASQGLLCAHRTAVEAYRKAQENLAHVEACRSLGLVV